MVDLSQAPVMGRFNGENPLDWVIQAETYFTFYNISSEHRLSWASFYLDGEALEWYRWLFRNKQLAGWDHFVDKVFIHFRGRNRRPPNKRLSSLQQFTTVANYPAQAVAIPSWSTITTSPSPQSWNAQLDYNKVNSAHQVFGEKLDGKPDIVVDVETTLSSPRAMKLEGCDENDTVLITHDGAELLPTQEKEEICHLVLDETKEDADFPVPQYCIAPLVYNNNEAHQMFDEFSDWSKDATLEPHKMPMMTTDTIEANEYPTVVGNEDKTVEEEIVTNENEIRQLVPAIVELPPLRIGTTICSFGDFVMFNMQHGPGIAQCFEEISGMLPTCRYDLLIKRGKGCSQFATRNADELCSWYFLVYVVNRKACYILVLADMLCTIAYSLTKVWDPGRHLLANSYISKIIEFKFVGVDISDILLPVHYVVGSAKRHDSTSFLLASTELVFTKGFLLEKDFHVLPVKSRVSYIPDDLLASAPYADVDKAMKHDLRNDSKLAWTRRTLCHVYHSDCCYNEAVLYETMCSTPWSMLSSFICTHNEWFIALCYLEKTRVKLPCIFTDSSLWSSSNLAEQMVVPRIICRIAGSFSLSICLYNDPIRSTMELLAIPGSSSLLGICYMPREVVIENLQVPPPSILYHMAMKLHITDVFVLNFSGELFYENVTFPSLVWFYLNLEDKVLISGGKIAVNQADFVRAYGLEVVNTADSVGIIGLTKMLENFIWDPGPINYS